MIYYLWELGPQAWKPGDNVFDGPPDPHSPIQNKTRRDATRCHRSRAENKISGCRLSCAANEKAFVRFSDRGALLKKAGGEHSKP